MPRPSWRDWPSGSATRRSCGGTALRTGPGTGAVLPRRRVAHPAAIGVGAGRAPGPERVTAHGRGDLLPPGLRVADGHLGARGRTGHAGAGLHGARAPRAARGPQAVAPAAGGATGLPA